MVNWPWAKHWDKPFSKRVVTRVSRIPTGELYMWAGNALNDISRCLDLYERTNNKTYLDEALVGSEALHAVVDALHTRKTSTL